MEIRKLTEDDDINAVSDVYEQSWKYAYKGIVPQDYLDSIPKGRWGEGLRSNGRISLIMLDGSKIIGTSSICRSRFSDLPDWGEIISIYFLPEYIGKGHGKALLSAAKNELQKMGFDKIFLWVLEENRAARRFYEKNGFSHDGKTMVSDIGGKELTEVRYVYETVSH